MGQAIKQPGIGARLAAAAALRTKGHEPSLPVSTLSRPQAWLTDALGGGRTAAGIHVTPERAAQCATVQACVRVLSETLGSLPVHLMHEDSPGRRRVAKEDPAYRLLYVAPNDWQTSREWRELAMQHVCYRGVHYSQIVRNRLYEPQALLPWHPDRVQVRRVPGTGETFYQVTDRDGRTDTHAAGDVFRLQWIPLDEYRATTPIGYARETIGLALASSEYRARFFQNSARPDVILSTPHELTDPGYERMRKDWVERYGGPSNWWRPAILEQGTTATPLTMSAVDAQFLEQQKFTRSEICGLMGVPPHLIADLDRATFSNIEHQSLAFLTHTVVPWVTRWEQALQRSLLSDRMEFFFRFEVGGLLRGDAKSRSDALAQQIMWGIRNPNEARALEDLNPYEGGDEYLRPANMLPLALAQLTGVRPAAASGAEPAAVAAE